MWRTSEMERCRAFHHRPALTSASRVSITPKRHREKISQQSLKCPAAPPMWEVTGNFSNLMKPLNPGVGTAIALAAGATNFSNLIKSLNLLLPFLTFCAATSLGQPTADTPEIPDALTQSPAPAAGKVAADLFWVADSRKMDEFLATVQLPRNSTGKNLIEVLPDTRTAWRDYAAEARAYARKSRTAEASARLGQMLKLAAVYRAFGGLENMVQSEDIRHLAGLTAAELGTPVSSKIRSPYIEKDAAQCVAVLESKIGDEMNLISPSFRRNLTARAVATHARLSSASSFAIAATP